MISVNNALEDAPQFRRHQDGEETVMRHYLLFEMNRLRRDPKFVLGKPSILAAVQPDLPGAAEDIRLCLEVGKPIAPRPDALGTPA